MFFLGPVLQKMIKAIVCDAYEWIPFPHKSAANPLKPVTKLSFADFGGPAVTGGSESYSYNESHRSPLPSLPTRWPIHSGR